MATQAELIASVQGLLQDTSYDSTIILAYLNQGQREISGRVLLPDLATTDTVSVAARRITAITLTDNAVVKLTITGHGLSSGDHVMPLGVVGTTEINGSIYVITSVDANNVSLDGTNYRKGEPNYTAYKSGTITGVDLTGSDVQITSNTHGLTTGDTVYITSVTGTTELNSRSFDVTVVDANTFTLDDTTPANYTAYVANGNWYTGYIMTPFVSLPSDYQRNLVRVTSESRDAALTIIDTWSKFTEMYPQLDDEGSLEACCVRGTRLYLQAIAETDDTLTLAYHRKPTDMAAVGATPDGIPLDLQEDLLVNYAAHKIFDERKGHTASGRKHHELFEKAMAILKERIGPEDKPVKHMRESGYYQI